MNGEVFVDRIALGAVVPMVKLRRGDEPAERTEFESHVGVNERGLHRHQADVREESRFGETAQVDRHVR